MSEDIVFFEKRRQVVQLEDRRFVVREMSASLLNAFTKTVLAASREFKDRLNGSDDIEELFANATQTEIKMLQVILSDALDPDKPADDEFLYTLSASQRLALFKLQEDLNGTADLVKNLQSLLMLQKAN